MEDEPPPEPLLVDVAAQIEQIMTTRFRFVPTAGLEVTRLLDESRSEIQRSWVDIAKNGRLYNRRVSE
jgi:hypothetical protein